MGNSLTNFFKRMFGKMECRILMVGLDAAGKTTVLYYFKLGKKTLFLWVEEYSWE